MQRLASVDAAWLRMDEPTNLMMITAVLWFDEPLDEQRLRTVLRERLVERFPRFQQRLFEPTGLVGSPAWVQDPDFHLDNHLGHLQVPAPGDRDALETLVSQWMSTPLERARPLWQCHLVEGFGHGGALLVRIHHCLADGMALARVLLSLMDEDAKEHAPPPPAPPAPPAPTGWGMLLRGARTMASGTRAALKRGAELANEPIHLGDMFLSGARGAATLSRLALMSSDPPTVFRGPLSTTKRAAWSDPIPLEEVKALGRALESTINDVLLAALTGALRRYQEERGGTVEDVRACIPVNLRPADEPIPRELGNRFGLVFLDLPVKEADPHRRIRELKKRMDALKRSPEAALTFSMLGMVGMVPAAVERLAVEILGAKGTLIMTNVPGPRHPVFLAGTQLAGLMFWVPQSGKVGLGVSIFSYSGQVTVGVSVDAGLVPDPHRLVHAFKEELQVLGSAS